MRFPSPDMIEELRKEFPVGGRVKLIRMEDPYSKLRIGDKGTVISIDDMATMHVNWDNGSSLGVVYGIDLCERIDVTECDID